MHLSFSFSCDISTGKLWYIWSIIPSCLYSLTNINYIFSLKNSDIINHIYGCFNSSSYYWFSLFSLIYSDIIHHVRLLHHLLPILSRRPELPPKKKPHEYFSNPNHYHQWPWKVLIIMSIVETSSSSTCFTVSASSFEPRVPEGGSSHRTANCPHLPPVLIIVIIKWSLSSSNDHCDHHKHHLRRFIL